MSQGAPRDADDPWLWNVTPLASLKRSIATLAMPLANDQQPKRNQLPSNAPRLACPACQLALEILEDAQAELGIDR
jgi:hypothetical protein